MSRSKAIQEYFDALERLKKNKPINIPKGSPINKDTVALEAGRLRGSIKKSREMFSELIEEIEKESLKVKEPQIENIKLKNDIKTYKKLYEESLARELMYLERINELEKKISNRKKILNVHHK